MNSPFAPLTLLGSSHLPFAKRRLGAKAFVLYRTFALPVRVGLANEFFARMLLRLTSRVPPRRALLARLYRRPIPFDALDVPLVHQQPFTEAVGAVTQRLDMMWSL